MKNHNAPTSLIITLLLTLCTAAYADAPVIVNNNNNNNNGAPSSGCNNNPPALDPRVPPSGVYSTQSANGSSNTQYTTGETKPYIVDNNCNDGAAPVQPYALVTPPKAPK